MLKNVLLSLNVVLMQPISSSLRLKEVQQKSKPCTFSNWISWRQTKEEDVMIERLFHWTDKGKLYVEISKLFLLHVGANRLPRLTEINLGTRALIKDCFYDRVAKASNDQSRYPKASAWHPSGTASGPSSRPRRWKGPEYPTGWIGLASPAARTFRTSVISLPLHNSELAILYGVPILRGW